MIDACVCQLLRILIHPFNFISVYLFEKKGSFRLTFSTPFRMIFIQNKQSHTFQRSTMKTLSFVMLSSCSTDSKTFEWKLFPRPISFYKRRKEPTTNSLIKNLPLKLNYKLCAARLFAYFVILI